MLYGIRDVKTFVLVIPYDEVRYSSMRLYPMSCRALLTLLSYALSLAWPASSASSSNAPLEKLRTSLSKR